MNCRRIVALAVFGALVSTAVTVTRRVPEPPVAVVETVVVPVPVREHVAVKPAKSKPAAPVREPKKAPHQSPAAPKKIPTASSFSCVTVRWYHDHLSASVLEAMAKTYGVTPAQRREAEACLRN